MAVMKQSDIQYGVKNNGQVLIVNEVSKYKYHLTGKPQVQFWPSTGRWRARGKTFSGGAKAFLNWYKKQRGNHEICRCKGKAEKYVW